MNAQIDRITRLESMDIKAARDENRAELRRLDSFGPWYGSPRLADAATVSNVPLGQTALLTFYALNPATDEPVTAPQIGSVDYFVNVDPTSGLVRFLGNSADPSSGFALPYTAAGFEPMVVAVPNDLSGRLIVIAGVDGVNNAPGFVVDLPIEEPRSILLLSSILGPVLLSASTMRALGGGSGMKQPDSLQARGNTVRCATQVHGV